MMNRLKMPEELKGLIRQATAEIPKELRFANSLFLDSQLEQKIREGMFYSTTASGLNLFEQKVSCFQLTGVWRTDLPLEIENTPLPLVIDLDYSGQRKERQQRVYRQLLQAGFSDLGTAQKMRLDLAQLDLRRLDSAVRLANPEDLEEILMLWNSALCTDPGDLEFREEELQSWISQQRVYCLYGQGELLGAVVCEIAGGSGIIWHLAVDSHRRGAGIGGRLLTTALDYARQKGARSSWLWVKMENQNAISFYHGMGYNSLTQFTDRLIRR